MRALVGERRRSHRVPAEYPAVIRDRRGRTLVRARTTNISEGGAFVVAGSPDGPPAADEVIVELTLPGLKPGHAGPAAPRKVTYRATIVRKRTLGDFFGLGLRFDEKIR